VQLEDRPVPEDALNAVTAQHANIYAPRGSIPSWQRGHQ
jgi:hypothetical protein